MVRMGDSFVGEKVHQTAAHRLMYGKLPDSLPELAVQPPDPGYSLRAARFDSIVSHLRVQGPGTSGAVVMLMICRKQGEPMHVLLESWAHSRGSRCGVFCPVRYVPTD